MPTAVKLNISAEELALARPETAAAMDRAIQNVLAEIDAAHAHQAASQVTLENASVLQLVQRLHQLVG